MTPGEEEIMGIYTDGIYCSPDMIKKSGGFWITSSSMKTGESCSRQSAMQPPITAASESDSVENTISVENRAFIQVKNLT